MNRHHPPPPPPPPPLPPLHPINHETTTQIFIHTTKIIFSHISTFLFLSLLIFTFRSNVRHGADYLSSFLDHDPSLKSLITRIELSHQNSHHHYNFRHRRRRPFLHLTRVGTLDDDFFSSDSEFDRSLFNPLSKPVNNASFLIVSKFNPNLGFSSPIIDNGIVVSKAIRDKGFSFRSPLDLYESAVHVAESPVPADTELNNNNNTVSGGNDDAEADADDDMVDLRFLLGLRLSRRDAALFFYLIGFLTAVYGYMILSFLVTYTCVYGIVFLQGVDHLLGRYRSVFRTLWDGSGIGIKRLAGFVLMRWAVRDALSQVVGIYFFGEVDDQYTIFKVLVRMKMMPFSDVSMLIKGHERESAGFILTWFFVELVVGLLFAVDSWVAIVDSRKSGKEIMKEGCHMLATMLFQSLEIKCWEAMACGTFTRWMLKAAGGELFTLVVQSFMEIYFMVVWLVFYLAARHKEATLMGRTFGQREVEGFLEGVR